MSAERLREAARVLRERAEAEAQWPCAEYIRRGIRHLQRNCDVECDHSRWNEDAGAYEEKECPAPAGHWDRYTTGAYIATMHPGVGLALADWLNWEARRVLIDHRDPAFAVADAILGGAA